MIKRFFGLSFLFMLILLAESVKGQDETIKILFVGNSYTYFWNLPQMVEVMGDSNGFDLMTRKSTAGGVTWKQHWEGDKDLKTTELIADGDWDFVVLQDHSNSTVDNIDQFVEYGGKLISLVKSVGATPILYETWAREFNPLMLEDIKSGYHTLAERHNINVLHIGEIWAYAMQKRPDLRLYDPDQSHPSTIGTYLTACAFFNFFTGEDASVLNHRISTTDKDGEVLYLTIMSEENAAYVQGVVDHLKNFQENE